MKARGFAGPEEFLACEAVDSAACLILDIRLGDANGLDLQQELIDSDAAAPIILVSGSLGRVAFPPGPNLHER
jgi:FixJ family two-component response regulator